MTIGEIAVIVFGGGGVTAGFLQIATWATKSLAERAKDRRSTFEEIIEQLRKQLVDERQHCDDQLSDLRAELAALTRRCNEADGWAARMEGVLYRLGIQPPPRSAVNERP